MNFTILKSFALLVSIVVLITLACISKDIIKGKLLASLGILLGVYLSYYLSYQNNTKNEK